MNDHEVHVLEVRVHGVRGTRPWESLGVDDKRDVQPCAPCPPGVGADSIDGRTGFYTYRRQAPTAGARSTGDPRPKRRPRLHVEAYSWGGLTSSPGGGLKPSFWLFWENLGRGCWLFLAPFALINVAMWSRPELSRGTRKEYASAVMIRWAGLLLTCLLVVTVCGIAVDLLAWQCFRHGRSYCSGIDLLSPFFARQKAVERIALSAVIPIIALVVLLLLSWQTIRKTEARQLSQLPAKEPDASGAMILRRPAFWEGKDRTLSLLLLHVAGGLCAISVSLAAPVHALEQAGSWALPFPLLLTVLVLGAVFVCLAVGVQDQVEFAAWTRLRRTRRVGPIILLGLSAATLAANILWLLDGHGSLDQSGQLPLTSDIQILITGGLFILVYLLAAILTAVWFAWVAGTILTIFTAMTIIDPAIIRENYPSVVVLLTAAYVAGVLVHWRNRRSAGVFGRALFGLAPAHLLGIAVFLGVMYSTLVTLWVAVYLDGRQNPALLIQSAPYIPTADITGQNLIVPSPFLWFAMLFVPGLLLAMISATFLCLIFRIRGTGAVLELTAKELEQGIETVKKTPSFRSRYKASLAHRGEALLGALVFIPLSLGFGSAAGMLSGVEPPFPSLVTAGLLAALVTGGVLVLAIIWSVINEEALRTVGIIWDLSTFWPRAAQPFSPPCYGERVVPELVERVRAGLTGEGPRVRDEGLAVRQREQIAPCEASDEEAAAARYDAVILSGHSLGSAILACVILQLSDREITDIRFVSYGSQLRAWFSRFFPALLGPNVLGHEVTQRPEFWSADPDAPQQGRKDAFLAPPGSLSALLCFSQRWRSFYRRTDPLGFPVLQDSENDLDLCLSEWDPPPPAGTGSGKRQQKRPQGHSHYQESGPYQDVVHGWLDEVARESTNTTLLQTQSDRSKERD